MPDQHLSRLSPSVCWKKKELPIGHILPERPEGESSPPVPREIWQERDLLNFQISLRDDTFFFFNTLPIILEAYFVEAILGKPLSRPWGQKHLFKPKARPAVFWKQGPISGIREGAEEASALPLQGRTAASATLSMSGSG